MCSFNSSSIVCAITTLREHFGEIVSDVGKCLLIRNVLPARTIAGEIKQPLAKVSQALCVLIQHHIVTFQLHNRGYVEYVINLSRILCRQRYPHYIRCAKLRYGEVGELLSEEFVLHGQLTMTSAILKVTNKLNDAISDENIAKISPSFVFEKFKLLAEDKFIVCCSPLKEQNDTATEESVVPTFAAETGNLYEIPKVNINSLAVALQSQNEENDGEPSCKKRRVESQPVMEDDGIYWKINYDRVHQFLRDILIISTVEKVIDRNAADIIQCIFGMAETQSTEWEATTNPVSRYDICRGLEHASKNAEMLDQYLSLLTDDKNGFLEKSGEGQGGLYCVNYKVAVISLTWATIENIVQERFGSKCLRLFRLIRLKKYLEQKQIEEMAMFPSKDAKEMTYRMFTESFLHIKEISRTADHAPSRTFYLFNIDLKRVVQTVLEWCYKAGANLVERRHHETNQNKRLCEKEQRIEAIVASLKQQSTEESQIQEVQEAITPMEQALLAKFKQTRQKLELSEIQLDETVFVLQLFLHYHNVSKMVD